MRSPLPPHSRSADRSEIPSIVNRRPHHEPTASARPQLPTSPIYQPDRARPLTPMRLQAPDPGFASAIAMPMVLATPLGDAVPGKAS